MDFKVWLRQRTSWPFFLRDQSVYCVFVYVAFSVSFMFNLFLYASFIYFSVYNMSQSLIVKICRKKSTISMIYFFTWLYTPVLWPSEHQLNPIPSPYLSTIFNNLSCICISNILRRVVWAKFPLNQQSLYTFMLIFSHQSQTLHLYFSWCFGIIQYHCCTVCVSMPNTF